MCCICIVNQVCLCQQDIIYYGMFGLSIPGATFLNTIKTGIQIYYDIKLVYHNLICLVIHFLKINQPNMTASFGNLILDKKVFAFNRDILKFGFQNLVKLSWKIYKLCSILIRQFFLQLNFPSIEFRIFPGSNIFIFAKCHISPEIGCNARRSY